jgi:hypothetical protein
MDRHRGMRRAGEHGAIIDRKPRTAQTDRNLRVLPARPRSTKGQRMVGVHGKEGTFPIHLGMI